MTTKQKRGKDPSARTISVPAARAAALMLKVYARIRRTGMSNADLQILLFLSMHGRPFRAYEIGDATSCTHNLIRQRTHKLSNDGLVSIRQVPRTDSDATVPAYAITRAGMDRIRGILAINHENRIQLPAAK